MGTTNRPGGAISLAAFTITALVVACTHLHKVPIQEVPIDSFVAGPGPSAVASAGYASDDAGRPVIIDEGPTSSIPVATAAGSGAQAAAGKGPEPAATADTTDDTLQAASKLIKTGKKNDLLSARKLLAPAVFGGNGTADEARLLRLVCSKLADKACVAKSAQYAK
jgi:hypothetical protein